MVTIAELSHRTGLSEYEIRHRVHEGRCPHVRVGKKQSKILIDYELFTQALREEQLLSMELHRSAGEDDGAHDG